MRIPQRVRDIELPQFDLLNGLARSWRDRGADVIGLGQGLPGFDPPPLALSALRESLDDPSSHVYSTDAGIEPLRTALARSLTPLGASVDPEREIIITAGGNQAFQLALTTLIEPGDEVILVSPYFLNHEMAVRSVSARPVEAPAAASRAFAGRWEDIAPHLSTRTTAIVVVTPSNPTGAVIAPSELQRIVRESAARDLAVIVDETYLRFTFDAPPATVLAEPDWRQNVVVVGSFSKAYAVTGWRCGYLIGAPAFIAEAMKIQDCMVICAPVPVQRAIAAVLEADPEYCARWLPELRLRRDVLVEGLSQVPGVTPVVPKGGFFVMAHFDGVTDSSQAALELIDSQQVVTVPGAFFGRAGEGFLRFSFGSADVDRLRAACERVARFCAPAIS